MGIERFPLSPMQQAMLFHSLAEPGAGFYVQQVVVDLKEELAPESIRRAFAEVCARYDILRSIIRWEGLDEPENEITSEVRVDWTEQDWTAVDEAERESRYARWLAEDRAREFSYTDAPPWRVTLFHFGPNLYRLVWTYHHLLLDGRSNMLLLEEIFARAARPPASPLEEALKLPEPRSYAEFIKWQRTQDYTAAESFWHEMLSGMPTAEPLPIVRRAPLDAATAAGNDAHKTRLPEETVRRLRDLAAREGVTLNTLVQAAWALMLSRYIDADDVTFGATRACRHWAPDGPNQIGLFINTLPMRTQIPDETGFSSWLQKLREMQIVLREYEHSPLPLVKKWSAIPHAARLFETVVVYDNLELSHRMRNLSPEWANRAVDLFRRTPGLSLSAYGGDGLVLTIEFDTADYDSDGVARMLDHLREIMEGFTSETPLPVRTPADARENPDLPRASDYPPLTDAERRRLIDEWNATELPVDLRRTVVDCIDEQAQRAPDALAATAPDGGRLTYGELLAQAENLARRLMRLGVVAEQPVAVLLEHSLDLIVSTLAIWKAGGTFLPLDPSWPERRQDFLLEDAGAVVLITSEGRRARFDGRLPIVIPRGDKSEDGTPFAHQQDQLPLQSPLPGPRPETRAYLIYTSGSTGEPKGVEVEHRHLANLCAHHQFGLKLTPADRSSTLAGVAFDATFTDVWPYLGIGASVHVPPVECRYDAQALIGWLRETRITSSFISTALAEIALREEWPPEMALRFFLTGGDKLYALPARTYPFTILNTYGPTECTVDATWSEVDPTGADAGIAPPIGRPVSNGRAYILDPEGRLLPVGVAGELYIGGAGVARGYLKRPELTAARFLPDPFAGDGSRMYRTGDLVRYRPDGVIEFLGRVDHQVQVRGVRVELGEIEAALKAHELVREAVVVTHTVEGSGLQLAAFVAVPDGGNTSELLRGYLRAQLPEAMVPSSIQVMETLPKNAAGKIDRAQLSAALVAPKAPAAEPETPAEHLIAGVWRRVLDQDGIGRSDKFFDVGGHSLLLMRLQNGIEKATGIRLSIPALMQNSTIAQQAAILDGHQVADSRSAFIALRKTGDGRPFIFVPGAGGGTHWFGDLVQSLDASIPCYGFEPLLLDAESPAQSSIEGLAGELVRNLRVLQPKGPYRLVGYSMGSLVAFEAARQLARAGEQIEVVGAIEGWIPESDLSTSRRLRRALVNLWRMDRSDKIAYLGSKFAYLLRLLNRRRQAEEISAAEAEVAPLKQAHTAASYAYRPQPYAGRLLLFRARRYPMKAPSDPHCGWDRLVQGGIELHWVPGDHYQVVVAPNCQVIARALMAARRGDGGTARP